MTKRGKFINAQVVREMAAQGFHQSAIAARVGISYRQFVSRLALDTELKAAWSAGVAEGKAARDRVGFPQAKRRGPKPKVIAIEHMTEKEKAEAAIAISKMMLGKALAGNTTCGKYILDRLMPRRK